MWHRRLSDFVVIVLSSLGSAFLSARLSGHIFLTFNSLINGHFSSNIPV